MSRRTAGEARRVRSSRLQLNFGGAPTSVGSIRNLATGTEICRKGALSLLVRTPRSLFDPTFLTETESFEQRDGEVRIVLADESRRYRAELVIAPTEDGLEHRLVVDAPEPIWIVEWRLTGLQLESVVLPALGGQELNRRMPADTQLTYKYPFWWNAQFALGMTRGGGIWLRSKDPRPRMSLVRVKRTNEGFNLSYGIEAEAPLTATRLEAMWYLDGFKGSWRGPVEVHRAWMEEAFGLTRLEENPYFPEWARGINFVLELWGIGKEAPEPFHTFDQMIDRLKRWATMHSPAETLVYLPAFAEHGIDSNAPRYNPSIPLGGEEGFRKLVDTAHRLGYRVMAHTNVLCMTFTHELYEQFRRHQVVDAFGREQGWALDIDGDWLAEPYFAYINPGAREWGDLMEQVLGELIRNYRLDAIFLDQTLLAFNVSRGPNFMSGMREHIARLQRAFPETLFAGEGLHEQVVAPLPMAQIHGIDSITEVHGMEGRAPWRTAHPVSTSLFGPYTRFTAHLLTRHPSHHMFAFQEASYAALGVIPALCLSNSRQRMDLPAVRKMIRRAKRL